MNQKPPIISGASKLKWFFFGTILFFLVAIFAGVVSFNYWLSIPPPEVVQADDGFKKAKATIDPEKLRAWALEEISKKQSTNTSPPDLEIPIYVRNLYVEPPEDFEVDTNVVTIYWGGGFFHWMIDIGDTNYTEPTGAVQNHFTTVEWVPGIYYCREDTRHPFK